MRMSTKTREAAMPIVLLLIGIMLVGGVFLTTFANQPLYHTEIWGDKVDAGGAATSTYWCWNQDGATVDLGWQNVEDVVGPFGEADFNTATIKGTLHIKVTDFGHRFNSVILNYAGDGALPDGSHALIGRVLDTEYQQETWWGDGSSFYVWDTTTLPDGNYVITLEGDYGAGPVTLTMFSMTIGEGNTTHAPIGGRGVSSNTTLLLLAGGVMVLAVLVYKKKL